MVASLPTDVPFSLSRVANIVALRIRDAFAECRGEFRDITRRASVRFAECDWQGLQEDSRKRLEVYAAVVDRVIARTTEDLADRCQCRYAWVAIKAVYSGLIHDWDDWEIAETFFNSVTRRIFATVGVDNEVEFVHTDYESPPKPARWPVFRSYRVTNRHERWIARVLRSYDLPWLHGEIHREAMLAAEALARELGHGGVTGVPQRVEMVKAVFYRGEYAFLIGRLVVDGHFVPLALCLRHGPGGGLQVDAVLTREDELSQLFSFARSYFLVDAPRPHDLVRFLKSLLPRKPRAEIYISLGFNKHGKTELYRHALRHLARSTDKYQLAPGQRGMVMAVFTMPSYPVVFKIIKDQFDYPKTCTRQSVLDRYRLVFRHDRAGRLVDAQEYQYLVLDRARFDDALIEELLRVAAQTVILEEHRMVFRHCYAERRVTPLNVYLRAVDEPLARAAVIDYGQAIRDLVMTNIFPGDFLIKNFGVTRRGRVVFYDYDEICLLTECQIREFPTNRDYDDEMADEPWYGVGEKDVFPEEFSNFLGLPEGLREVFMEHHGDLFQVSWWRDLQRRVAAGDLFDVAPYPVARRIGNR